MPMSSRNIATSSEPTGGVVPSISPQGVGQRVGQADAAGLHADEHHAVEAVVALDDLVGHPPDGSPHVVGVHHLAPGNENAPVRGRRASFAFGHGPVSFLPSGPHRTRLTSEQDHSTGPLRDRDRSRVGGVAAGDAARGPSSSRAHAHEQRRRRPTRRPAAGAPAPSTSRSRRCRRRGRSTTARPRRPPRRRARRRGRGSGPRCRRSSSPAIQRSAAARSRAVGHAGPPLDLRVGPRRDERRARPRAATAAASRSPDRSGGSGSGITRRGPRWRSWRGGR